MFCSVDHFSACSRVLHLHSRMVHVNKCLVNWCVLLLTATLSNMKWSCTNSHILRQGCECLHSFKRAKIPAKIAHSKSSQIDPLHKSILLLNWSISHSQNWEKTNSEYSLNGPPPQIDRLKALLSMFDLETFYCNTIIYVLDNKYILFTLVS